MKRCRIAGFVCLYLFIAIQSAPAQTDWQWQYPVPQGNLLYDVEYFSSNTAIVVGTTCTVIITTDGGSSWAVIPNAAGLSETLRAVCMIDALTAIAVGGGGTIIRTTDGGVTWAAQASGTSESLYNVTFTSANTGYAVGGSGTILITTDVGASWSPLSSGSGALLYGVSFAHPDIGTAVGSQGTILRTTDGGSSWANQTSGTTITLNAVQCINVNTGYAVGKDLVLKTTDGGATWNALATPFWSDPTLEDLSFVDTDIGFIVGHIYSYDYEPAIFISTEDGGSSWVYTEPPNHMFGVSRLDYSRGLAVGKMGVIRRTLDGGMTWPVIGGPTPEYSPTFMGGLDCWDINNGVAVTSTNRNTSFNTSTILRTTDGGVTWSGILVGTGSGVRLVDISYADENTVYAVGHGFRAYDFGAVIYRSLDGGASWEKFWSVLCWPLNPGCVWHLHDIDFGDANHGVAIGPDGTVITIGSAGVGYQPIRTNTTLTAVSMPDSSTVFAVGNDGVILQSIDGGNNWLPIVSGVSVSLNGVHFINTNSGTVVGDGGTILRTWNGGGEWCPQTSGTTDNLSRVSFSSTLAGYIISQSGTILKTTDGGTTWTAELSPTGELSDVHTIDQNVTIVGGNWNILTKQDETVPVCEVAPNGLDFGVVYQDDSLDMSFIIKNIGIYTINGSVSESCEYYSIVTGEGSYSLEPGESLTVSIRFAPTEVGHFTCLIETGCGFCDDVYCTGYSPQGQWVWDGIPVCTTMENQTYSNTTMVEPGKAIIAWLDARYDKSLFAQKIDIWGKEQWAENGVEIVRNPGIDPSFWNPARPLIVPDGSGGAYIVYDERTSFPDACYLYVQLINSQGVVQWSDLGVSLIEGSFTGQTRAISDGKGGVYVVGCGVASVVSGNDIDLYRVKGSGTVYPDADGLDICTMDNYQNEPDLIGDGAGNVIISWADARSAPSTGYDIYVQKARILDVPDMGFVFWSVNGIPICMETGNQEYPRIAEDGAGGAYIIWLDSRDGPSHIYGQRIDQDGNPLWAPGGIPVCTLTGWSGYPYGSFHNVVSDGEGGVIVAWEDYRNGNYDIYAVRLDGSGNPLWTENGIPVCVETGNQSWSRLVANGLGEFIITWQDERDGNRDVYAQKIDLLGLPKWTFNGEIISAAAQSQEYPYIAADDYGGAMIVWQDLRSGNYDIYAQRICEYVAPIATMLQSYTTSVGGGRVTIEWSLSSIDENARFSVLRNGSSGDGFIELDASGIKDEGLSYSFIDLELEPGSKVTYRVLVTDEEDERILFETEALSIPAMKLTLFQNHPNPFNPSTTIRYYLPEKERVTLDIFDVTGRHVKGLIDKQQDRGPHSVQWMSLNNQGAGVVSGVYFYKLTAGKETLSRKMLLLR